MQSNDNQNNYHQDSRQDSSVQSNNYQNSNDYQNSSAQNDYSENRQESPAYRDTQDNGYQNDTVQSNQDNRQEAPRQDAQPYRDVSVLNNSNEQAPYQDNRYENSQQNETRPDTYEYRQESQPVHRQDEQNPTYQQTNENQPAPAPSGQENTNANQSGYGGQENTNQGNTQNTNQPDANQTDQNKVYGYATANEIESARQLTESLERQAEEARRQADAVRQAHEQELMKDSSVNQSKQAYDSAVNAESVAKTTYEQAQAQANNAEQNYYRTVETQVNNTLNNDANYQKLQADLQNLEAEAAKGNPRPYEESIAQTKAAMQAAEDNARTQAYASAEAVAAKSAWETQSSVASQAQSAYDSARSETYKAENAYNANVADYADSHGMNDLKEAWETSKTTSEQAAKAHNDYMDNLAKTPESIREVDNLRQELNSASAAKNNYSNTVEHFERQERLSESASRFSRYEFEDRKEYEQAVAVLEQKGVKVLSSTAMMSNDKGKNVYVLQVNRSMGSHVEDVIKERGLNGSFHGHIYKDGSYEAKRTDDNHGMGREEKDVNKTKKQYQSGLSGYGNLMLRETGELYHAYLLANDINDFIKGAQNAAAMQTASMNSEGVISFHMNETGDAGQDAEGQYRYRMDLWKNPYEAVGMNGGAFEEAKMRLRGDKDEFVEKLGKSTGKTMNKDMREVAANNLTRADVADLTKNSLNKLHAAGMIPLTADGALDIAGLNNISSADLQKLGIDPEVFKKVVVRDLKGIEQWGAFAGIRAAGASVGKGLLKFTSKFDDNEGNLSQTVNEVRQGVDYVRRPVQEIQKAARKAQSAWQSRRQIRNPGSAAANKVDASKVKIEKPQSAKVKKRQAQKIKKQEKAVARASRNVERRLKILEKWDRSVFGRAQKKLATMTSNFFAKTAIGKAIAGVASTVSTVVSTILIPAIAIALAGIVVLAMQVTAVVVIVCLVNSLFDYEISPDEGVTYTIYHDILLGYENDWIEQLNNVNGEDAEDPNGKHSLWYKIEHGDDIRFGYNYEPWFKYAENRQHLIVKDTGHDVPLTGGKIHYNDLEVYLNPFNFEPMYPADYYKKISKEGEEDTATGVNVAAFGDAGNMLTFYPNMTSLSKKGAGGHTSNSKDIICMMDIMFNFQKTDDAEVAEVTDTTGVSLAHKWIEDKLKYGLRLIMDFFVPTPHDPSIPIARWSHMKAYCENLFTATHQEMIDIDVIIFNCRDNTLIDETTIDMAMEDANYRDSLLGSYLDSGCPGKDGGGCRQSKFYACVGGSTGAYTAHLGVLAKGVSGSSVTVDGQFGHVGTLEAGTSGTFDRVTCVDTDTHWYCLNNEIISDINSSNGTAYATTRLKNHLSSDKVDCWKMKTISPTDSDKRYIKQISAYPDSTHSWHYRSDNSGAPGTPLNPSIHVADYTDDSGFNQGLASILAADFRVKVWSYNVGDDKTYCQAIALAIPRWEIDSTYTATYYYEYCGCSNCSSSCGDDCDDDCDEKEDTTTMTLYKKVYDVYYWSVSCNVSTGQYNTAAPVLKEAAAGAGTDANDVNLSWQVLADGTVKPYIYGRGITNASTCTGHECRYCGGHTFVDVKGIVFSFTDSQIAAANGKIGNFDEEDVYIIPVIDEEELVKRNSIAEKKGSATDDTLIHVARRDAYRIAQIHGLNILVNDPENPTQWVSGYDADSGEVISATSRDAAARAVSDATGGMINLLGKTSKYMAPLVNPNAYMTATQFVDGFEFDGVALNPWNDTGFYQINRMLFMAQDIFDVDASIDYPNGFFPTTEDSYSGWTATNMFLALQRYNMSWEDTYDFDVPINFRCPQLSDAQISDIVEGVRKSYGGLKKGEEDAITAALKAVGNGQYSQMHHQHGYLLNLDASEKTNYDWKAKDQGLVNQAAHPCTATDCSGFASYVITMGGDSRILNDTEHVGDHYAVWATTGGGGDGGGFMGKINAGYGGLWDGSTDSLSPGDIFIHTGEGAAHALVYIGCLEEDLTLSWVTEDGGYTFAKIDGTSDYEITSTITIKAGKPITVDCTRMDSMGNIYLRNGGITHSWLKPSDYITSPDAYTYVYHPDYPD